MVSISGRASGFFAGDLWHSLQLIPSIELLNCHGLIFWQSFEKQKYIKLGIINGGIAAGTELISVTVKKRSKIKRISKCPPEDETFNAHINLINVLSY